MILFVIQTKVVVIGGKSLSLSTYIYEETHEHAYQRLVNLRLQLTMGNIGPYNYFFCEEVYIILW